MNHYLLGASLVLDSEQQCLWVVNQHELQPQCLALDSQEYAFLAALVTEVPLTFASALFLATQQPLSVCEERIEHSRGTSELNSLLTHEVECVLARCKHRIEPFGVTIRKSGESGFVLHALPDPHVLHRETHSFYGTAAIQGVMWRYERGDVPPFIV